MIDQSDTNRIRQEIEDGNLILAYDQLRARLASNHADERTRYLYVLTLARMGLTERALEAYDTHQVSQIPSTEAQAIHPRLLKDRALAKTGTERSTALREAAEAYFRVYAQSGSLFPAINAASLFALAGEADRAMLLARKIIAAKLPDHPGYYDLATLAEAQAILGQADAARAALQEASLQPGAGTGARAVTARQIDLILAHHGLDASARAATLSPLSAGRAVWICSELERPNASGEITLRSEIQAVLMSSPVAAAFGSLNSVTDLIAAEVVLLADIPLFLFLPAPAEDVAERLSDIAQTDLTDLVRRCLAGCTEQHVVNDAFHGDTPLGNALSRRLAWGKALAYGARNLCQAHRLEIIAKGQENAQSAAHLAGSATTLHVEPAPPLSPPNPAPAAPTRREVSMLFADFAGFSALPDRFLPQLVAHASGALAEVLEEIGHTHLFSNTWGDAFFAVLPETGQAVHVAQSLLARIEADPIRDLIKGLRISLHHGLAMEIFDPVLGSSNYFGREVSRAARIEPVTPPGCIYASEAFVLADASAGDPSARFEYVGQIALPKQFGTERLYLVVEPPAPV